MLDRVGQSFLPNVQQVLLPNRRKLIQLALSFEAWVERRSYRDAFNHRLERVPKGTFLQRFRTERMHRSARFAQTLACQLARPPQVFVCLLRTTMLDCFLG